MIEGAEPLRGSEISTESSFVKPDSWYLGRRSISLLEQVGALTPLEKFVAQRADGILGHRPPNGMLGARELALLEKPEVWDSLFQMERDVIPKLWSLLELVPATQYESPCTFGETLRVKDHDSWQRPNLVYPIDNLAIELQLTALRIQLQYDSDGDPETISGTDLHYANRNSVAYMPQEAANFQPILDVILDQMPPPDPAFPRWVVADVACQQAVDTGEVNTTVQQQHHLTDTWWWQGGGKVNGLALSFSRNATFEPLATGDELMVFDLTTGAEAYSSVAVTFEQPQQQSPIDGRLGLRVERWRAGERVQIFELEFASDLPERQWLDQVLPLELGSTGQIRFPNYDEATALTGGGYLNVKLRDTPSEPDAWQVAWSSFKKEFYKAGTYRCMNGQLSDYDVSLYAGGWVVVRENGQFTTALVPNNQATESTRLFVRHPGGAMYVWKSDADHLWLGRFIPDGGARDYEHMLSMVP